MVDDAAPLPAEGEAPKMKSVAKTTNVWELINKQVPFQIPTPGRAHASFV